MTGVVLKNRAPEEVAQALGFTVREGTLTRGQCPRANECGSGPRNAWIQWAREGNATLLSCQNCDSKEALLAAARAALGDDPPESRRPDPAPRKPPPKRYPYPGRTPKPPATLPDETQRWSYAIRTDDGDDVVIQWVIRLDPPEGRKSYRQLSWNGHRWIMKAAQNVYRDHGRHPLYRLAAVLDSPPRTPVLVTEGEKAALSAELLADDEYVVTSPLGGAKQPHLSDWSPLRGRDVIVWPDLDDDGSQFATDVTALVHAAGARSVRTLVPPADREPGWDAADLEAEHGLDLAAARAEFHRLLTPPPIGRDHPLLTAFGERLDTIFPDPPDRKDRLDARRFRQQLFAAGVEQWMQYCPAVGWLIRTPETHYQPDESGDAATNLISTALDMAAARRALVGTVTPRSVIDRGSAGSLQSSLFVRAGALDADPYLVGTTLGRVISLRTGNARPGRRTDLVTKSLAVAPWPGPTPCYDLLLSQLCHTPEERAWYLDFVAAGLLGHATRTILAVIGPSHSGKSSLNKVHAALLRDYAQPLNPVLITRLGLSRNHGPELATLRGIRFAYVNDAPLVSLHAGVMKDITDGVPLRGEPKFLNPFSFVPEITLTLTSNENLAVQFDSGWHNRLVVIPGPPTLQRPDPTIRDRAATEELPAVAELLIEALRARLARGRALPVPDRYRRATSEMLTEADPAVAALEEYLEPTPDWYTTSRTLLRWLKSEYDVTITANRLATILQHRGIKPHRTNSARGWMCRVLSRSERYPPSAVRNLKAV